MDSLLVHFTSVVNTTSTISNVTQTMDCVTVTSIVTAEEMKTTAVSSYYVDLLRH